MAKTYQLMAWTDKGQVKMIPSLVAELAEPYIRQIQAADDEPRARGEKAETDQLIRRSRAYEALARFFLRVGYWEDAFLQYAQAAMVVTFCSDELWIDADEGFLLHTPLEHRFLSMYGRCKQLAEDHPTIKESTQWETLNRRHRTVTEVHRIWADEFREVSRSARAWRFGKR